MSMMERAIGALRGGEIADGTIADLIPLFVGRTVLVLGDVMLDRYVSGEVSRISPEAPIPVLRVTATRTSLGGAANVAHNVAALGARAILIGVIGGDDAGAEIERLVAQAGNGVDARLFASPHRPTTVKTRFTTGGAHQLLRVDDETADPIDDESAAEVRQRFARALTESDVVVLSDYAKGVLSDRVLRGVINLSRRARRPVIADPKRASFKAYRNITVLTPQMNIVLKHNWCNKPGALNHHRNVQIEAITISIYMPAAPIQARCHLFGNIQESETLQYRHGVITRNITPISWHSPPKCLHVRPWPNS